MLFGKCKRTVNPKKGKALYYQYNGNKFGLWHELGVEDEDCNVPKEIETEWKKDILSKLEREIAVAQGVNLQVAVGDYLCLSPDEEWLMRFLRERETDTFTAIILCEELKDMMRKTKDRKKAACIRGFSDEFKIRLSDNPVTVHETYKTSEFMRDYDFSENNIKSRIQAI